MENTYNEIDFKILFESSPALMLVLSPELTILAASKRISNHDVVDQYLNKPLTVEILREIANKYF